MLLRNGFTVLFALTLIASNFFFSHVIAQADGLRGISVTLVVGGTTRSIQSSAPDVGALLEEQGVMLGKDDIVYPSLADRVTPNQTIRVVRITRWMLTERHAITPQTVRRLVFSLQYGKSKILSYGNTGIREALVRYEQRDNGHVTRSIVGGNIVRHSHPRIIGIGTNEYAAFQQLERHGLDKTAYVASRTLRMVATAYTAGCVGCSGITAIGRHAGHGIVAVDPRYIPLGTHLYIPGYGLAIAGDTGGAIHGNRIDLGFNSISDALQFGRRAIVVYQLK